MKFTIKNIKLNPVDVLRRVGYTYKYSQSGEMSFVRPLASAGYPRFHAFARLAGRDLEVSFHLDQKKETYGENTRHHGEYENEGALKEEVKRILSLVESQSLPNSEKDYNIL